MDLRQALQDNFDLDDFRPGQREVIEANLEGRDICLIMPTGGGKSVCFQLPALLKDGVTFVISPLIALMKDQVDALEALELPATFLNSSLKPEEKRERAQAIRAGEYKLIYVAPESFNSSGFVPFVQSLDISGLVIDECHCISQYGHDFRPDYRKIKQIRAVMGNPQTTACTATATVAVRKDIMEQVGMNGSALLKVTGFDRPNLTLSGKFCTDEAVRDDRVRKYVRELLTAAEVTPAIFYCTTKKQVDALAVTINKLTNVIHERDLAAPYHSGMTQKKRKEVQEAFISGETPYIAATIAFGMGIDKANIRNVVHATLPSSVEAYYQEVGRAGRDDEPANCSLFYCSKDITTKKFFIEIAHPFPGLYVKVFDTLNRILPKDGSIKKITYKIFAMSVAGGERNALIQAQISTILTQLKHKGAFIAHTRGQMALPHPSLRVKSVYDLGIDFPDIAVRKAREEDRLQKVEDLIEAEDKKKFILDYFGA